MSGRRCRLSRLLLFVSALVAALPASAAGAAAPTQLPSGARIGVVSMLDAEVTHFHASRQIENSFLKTYPVSWSVSGMLLASLAEPLGRLGLVAVPLAPSDELARAREPCFLNAALGKGLPRECAPLFARLAAAQQLNALIVLGPGHNDATHAGSTRHRELPEYLRGWCFVTGEGAEGSAPLLLDLSELLLIRLSPAGAELAARAWGGEGENWAGYRAPPDLKAFAPQQLAELQPLFAALLQRQAQAVLTKVQVVR